MYYKTQVVNRGGTEKYYDYREAFLHRYMEGMRVTEFRIMFMQLLAQKGITGAGFARLVGCSKTWPSNIINDRHRGPATLEMLEKWADALELNGKERWRFIGLGGLDHAPQWWKDWYWSSGKHL